MPSVFNRIYDRFERSNASPSITPRVSQYSALRKGLATRNKQLDKYSAQAKDYNSQIKNYQKAVDRYNQKIAEYNKGPRDNPFTEKPPEDLPFTEDDVKKFQAKYDKYHTQAQRYANDAARRHKARQQAASTAMDLFMGDMGPGGGLGGFAFQPTTFADGGMVQPTMGMNPMMQNAMMYPPPQMQNPVTTQGIAPLFNFRLIGQPS